MITLSYPRKGNFSNLSTFFFFQVYLVFHFSKWRRLQTGTILALLVLSSYYLSNFRNTVQISFHIVVALFSTAVILSRQLTEKLPGYSVWDLLNDAERDMLRQWEIRIFGKFVPVEVRHGLVMRSNCNEQPLSVPVKIYFHKFIMPIF